MQDLDYIANCGFGLGVEFWFAFYVWLVNGWFV